MIKKVLLYKDKYIDVDTSKVKKYVFTVFCILLVTLFIIIPEYQFFPNTLTIKTTYILCVAYICAFIYLCVKIYEKSYKLNIYDILLSIYIVLLILSCVFSEYKQNVIFATETRCEGLLVLIAYLIVFYMFKESFKYNNKIFNLLTISILLVSCFGIVQALIGRYYGFSFDGIGQEGKYMTYGTMSNPNMFSSFLTLFLPIYIVKYLNSKEKIYLPICTVIFGALICTKTFGGYITFLIYFAVLSIYFVVISKNKKQMLLKILLIIMVFSTIFVVLDFVNDNMYVKEFVSNVSSDEGNDGKDTETLQFGNNRGYIWKMTLDIIKKNPIFGVGPDSLKHEVYYNYYNDDEYIFGKSIVDKAHCEYLHIAATTGIPSLIVYVILIFIIIIRLLKKFIEIVREKKINSINCTILISVSASIFAYLFQAAANISDVSVAPLFWAMLGIGANISKKETQSE